VPDRELKILLEENGRKKLGNGEDQALCGYFSSFFFIFPLFLFSVFSFQFSVFRFHFSFFIFILFYFFIVVFIFLMRSSKIQTVKI